MITVYYNVFSKKGGSGLITGSLPLSPRNKTFRFGPEKITVFSSPPDPKNVNYLKKFKFFDCDFLFNIYSEPIFICFFLFSFNHYIQYSILIRGFGSFRYHITWQVYKFTIFSFWIFYIYFKIALCNI